MIITDNFVFIHLHKTGGQFINNAIMAFIPKARQIGYHYPISMVPNTHIGKKIIGFVRNPWDWYVSWYWFNQNRPNGNPLFVVMSNNYQNNFNSTINNLLNFGSDDAASQDRLEDLRQRLPLRLDNNRGVGLTKKCLDSATGSYYSWLLNRMFDFDHNNERLLIGKQENLRQDLIDIMLATNVELTNGFIDHIKSGVKLNSSSHQHYRQYYEQSLVKKVYEQELYCIRKFNYQF